MTAVTVTVSTDDMPGLAEEIERRHEFGLDTYDEWWEGTYRVVTGPSPEHGQILARLIAFLLPLADQSGLDLAAPINIGIDKFDCRVPDIGIYEPDTPRTSPAFLQTARLVVEVISPTEKPGTKHGFYRNSGVEECLEINTHQGTIQLWDLASDKGLLIYRSQILQFDVTGSRLMSPSGTFDLQDHIPHP